MTTEQELRQKLRKIAALFEEATTVGERDAAAAALNRIRVALSSAEKTERTIEVSFRLPDRWILRRPINPTVYSIEEFRRKARAQDHFLTTVLDGAKQFVKGNERELEEIIGKR